MRVHPIEPTTITAYSLGAIDASHATGSVASKVQFVRAQLGLGTDLPTIAVVLQAEAMLNPHAEMSATLIHRLDALVAVLEAKDA